MFDVQKFSSESFILIDSAQFIRVNFNLHRKHESIYDEFLKLPLTYLVKTFSSL